VCITDESCNEKTVTICFIVIAEVRMGTLISTEKLPYEHSVGIHSPLGTGSYDTVTNLILPLSSRKAPPNMKNDP
jgi:hypothetical protein